MTAARALSGGPSPVAKWFAILGTAVQCSLFVGIAFFVVGILETFAEITAAGTSDPELMAQGIGQALVPVVLALGIGVWGTFISLVTTAASNYRSRWFFWSSVVFSVVYLIAFPIGTVLGLSFLVLLVVKRREFRRRTEDVNMNARAHPHTAAEPEH